MLLFCNFFHYFFHEASAEEDGDEGPDEWIAKANPKEGLPPKVNWCRSRNVFRVRGEEGKFAEFRVRKSRCEDQTSTDREVEAQRKRAHHFLETGEVLDQTEGIDSKSFKLQRSSSVLIKGVRK